MNARAAQLAARRAALQLQCDQQRHEIRQAVGRIRTQLEPFDRVLGALHSARTVSVIVAGVAGLALALLSNRAMGTVGRVSLTLTTLQRLWTLLSGAARGTGVPARRER